MATRGKQLPAKKQCLKCEKEKSVTVNFFLSESVFHSDKRYPVCKTCIKEQVKHDDIRSVQDILMQMNKPFLYDIYESTLEEAQKLGREDIFGTYIKNVNLNSKNLNWNDSIFGKSTDEEENSDEKINKEKPKKIVITDEIIAMWGEGYTAEEYRAFERKYGMLKNNYQEKTAMHTEALLTYIRYRVKEELATAKDLMKEAKDWGQLAQKAAQDAKINPSQLSKSDLSDGLDTFGQLVRSVEQAVDIIPILPKFKEKPQDKVDFTLFCYVNYIRDLKGLPLAEYSDVYNFYEERKKEYEGRNEGFE